MSLLATLKAGVNTGFFKHSGRGGPNRLIVIAGVAGLMAATLIGVRYVTSEQPLQSKVVKLPKINSAPGGLKSDAAQEALRLRHEQQGAETAGKEQKSYTPSMPGSTAVKQEVAVEPGMEPASQERAAAEPVKAAIAEPPPEIRIEPVPKPAYTPPEPRLGSQPHVQKINSEGMDPEIRRALLEMFNGWDTRAPRTEVVLTPAAEAAETAAAHNAGSANGATAKALGAAVSPSKVLVPAGRGVYAHTIVAVDSDTGGPIILEADTGPLAGDRLIGSFAKSQGDRLVVHVSRVEHGTQSLDVNGIVTSPETMETSVASSVDEHYLERFILPAGVAFIEGLGQAVALSNSSISSNGFGGTMQSFGPLKIKQEAEIAAGSAAQTVGQELNMSIPKGPTVRLAANAGVGVMFLTNVEAKK
jgi:intracellular multiplication protein IcmE